LYIPEINMMPVNKKDATFRGIIDALPELLYHKGRCLYGADEAFRGLFVVMSGAVKHYRLTEEGEEMVTGFCLPGEWCGLPDLLSGQYTGYAQALDTCTARRFPPALLTEVMTDRHRRRDMYTLMSDVIRRNKTRYYQISQTRANARFAMFILDLSHRFGQLGYSPREFRLPMTRGDIANYLGMTRETISREVTRMEHLDILSFRNRYITLQHPEALKAFIVNA